MKRLAELTEADLMSTAIWRYSGGPDAFASVWPEPDALLSDGDSEIYLARTEFTLDFPRLS